MTLSAKSSLILGMNKAVFCREGHYTPLVINPSIKNARYQPFSSSAGSALKVEPLPGLIQFLILEKYYGQNNTPIFHQVFFGCVLPDNTINFALGTFPIFFFSQIKI